MAPGEAPSSTSPGRDRTPADKSRGVPIAVTWSESQRLPVAFTWRRRHYRIERIFEAWIIETGWWKENGHLSHSCWRVRAEGRVFDLRYDRLTKAWALERALN